jgi:hypothetical protein
MAIQSTQVTGAGTPVLVVPLGKSWAVTTMLFCNTALPQDIYTDEGDTYLDLHLCKGGESQTLGNMVLNNIPIAAGDTFSFDTEKIILEEGDTIRASTTSPTTITATVSYIEV